MLTRNYFLNISVIEIFKTKHDNKQASSKAIKITLNYIRDL